QIDSAPERDNRPGFIPVPAPVRHNVQAFNPSRKNLRPVLAQQQEHHAPAAGGGLWDSEDSEGPCSTV
ncbi:hypothetical protein CHARACLAT_023636, partial [Characodon lateralis]|nr:hypothetical protein [Characodon lateralis]